MFKNVESQKVVVYAWDSGSNEPKTGDAAQITAQISKDGGASVATNDVNPTELDAVDHPGVYIFDMLQAETNADLVVITPDSSTASIVFRPSVIYTKSTDAGVAGAVWDVTASSHVTAGSFGAKVRTLVNTINIILAKIF
jgi:hypothetical protein